MDTRKASPLARMFTFLFLILFVLIISLGILILVMYQNQDSLSESSEQLFNSHKLANELRQSSDDLTRMVRAYVATGNPEFEREYWAVLDIRNGKIPRPLEYERIYWDFVAASGEKPRPDGEAIPLTELMKKEGFTTEELDKLILAQNNSDALVEVETVAMNAMKGLYQDGEGNFTTKKAPDQELANRLVNDDFYFKTKAEIMKPIDDFFVMFNERTKERVNGHLRTANSLLNSAMALGGLTIVLFGYFFIRVRQQILVHEKTQKELIDLRQQQEQIIKDRTRDLEQSKSTLEEKLNENEKINKLMVGREIKLFELKKEIEEIKKPKTVT